MVTIRCTQRLLRRLQCVASPPPSDTLLGDWYANIFFARPQQLILCVSERTLLPVVLLARPAGTIRERLADSLHRVLLQLGVSPGKADAECAKMNPAAFGPTQNRRVLGTLNDFMVQLSWRLHDDPAVSLLEASLWLAETPCSPIGRASPNYLSAELFANARAHAMLQ